MTDGDYIRKAVELADGYSYNGDQKTMSGCVLDFVRTPIGTLSVSWDSFCDTQAHLDALAAQLVRQVDALDGYIWFESEYRFAGVYKDSGENYKAERLGCSTENDRTMNTIKAIVDSGVLP